ncbi:hypothetical protein Tco_0147288, partial [Tanacetum coccineum]
TDDPFDDLDEILGDNANTEKEITGKEIIVHVGSSYGNFKEVEVDTDNEIEEESNTKENDTSGIDSEDLDYDPKHDEMFDDDDHILFNDLDDGIDSERRIQLKELRRICKAKNQGPNTYYFYLGQQFATNKIVNERVKKN